MVNVDGYWLHTSLLTTCEASPHNIWGLSLQYARLHPRAKTIDYSCLVLEIWWPPNTGVGKLHLFIPHNMWGFSLSWHVRLFTTTCEDFSHRTPKKVTDLPWVFNAQNCAQLFTTCEDLFSQHVRHHQDSRLLILSQSCLILILRMLNYRLYWLTDGVELTYHSFTRDLPTKGMTYQRCRQNYHGK